jgi:glycosyltransferase involved in cell wall biosynthesis
MTRVRILYVTELAVLGGEQYHILTFLRLLNRERFELAIACAPQGPFVDAAAALGVPHIPVEMRSKYDLRAIHHLVQIFRSGSYHIVHLHGARAGVLGRIAAKLARVPTVVWTLHVFQLDVLQGWRRVQRPLYIAVEKLLAHVTDLIITETDTHRRKLIEVEGIDPARIVRIYASINVKGFERPFDAQRKRQELGLAEANAVVGTIARLSPQKGIEYFLRAVPAIQEAMRQVRFLVVGDGPLRSWLEAEVQQLGITSSVTFTGYRKDAHEIMRSLDVFVLPTLWESFGLVLAEAMASKVPVVASSVEPIPEVLDGYEAARLVPPRNPRALAQAVVQVLQQREYYRAQAEQGPMLVRKYAWENMVRDTAEVYEDLIAHRQPVRFGEQ